MRKIINNITYPIESIFIVQAVRLSAPTTPGKAQNAGVRSYLLGLCLIRNGRFVILILNSATGLAPSNIRSMVRSLVKCLTHA